MVVSARCQVDDHRLCEAEACECACHKLQTRWNGEPCVAFRVRVRVGSDGPVAAWWRGLEGTERAAVRVVYGGHAFLLDDDEWVQREADPILAALNPGATFPRVHPAGLGWAKVTEHGGSPAWGHRELPPDSAILGER